MDVGTASMVSKEAIRTLMAVSMPVLLVALVVGLIISLFQALTQIQETTLTFIPKMLAVFLSLMFTMPYIFTKLQIFTDHIIQIITRT